jgi:UDP-glucose:(heptosyl)LPS alpha-1,3-glucosyltransferase
LQRVNTIVALSQTVADDLSRLHGVRQDQIQIIYNGVDCQRFSPAHRHHHRDSIRRGLRVDDQQVLLLFAAHNFRLKGLLELLAVVARLVANRRPVRLAVAGGKRLAHWRRSVARLGLADHVTFIGTVSDVVPYYAAADVFVHPTYFDPCSLVLLEAAASGLPIVTTRRHNGAAELFRDGEDMLMVNDPFDSEALYERLDFLCDERVRLRLGSAARKVALEHTFERNVRELLSLYEVVNCRRQAA